MSGRNKPIQLRIFGAVGEYGQRLTIQITSRRTGKKWAIGVAFHDVGDGWLPLAAGNRLLVRCAWLKLRGALRAHRGNEHPLAAIHIKGTVST